MKKIAIIDKCPSKNNYSQYFDFDFEHFHMVQEPVTKLTKKMVDLEIDLSYYDFVILVGAEPAKEYAKVTSVTDKAGHLIDGKFICMSNPAMLHFKPEGKPLFQRTVDRIKEFINGTRSADTAKGDYKGILNSDEAMEYLLEVLNSNAPFVTVDTETTALYPRDGYVLGLSLSYRSHQGRYISTDCLYEEHLAVLKSIIAKYKVIFHNMKFDYKMIFYHLGLDFVRMNVGDTMLMHYVLDENDSHGLKQLALKYTDYGDYDAPLEEFKKHYCKSHGIKEEDFTYDLIPFDIISEYASIDTAVTFDLALKFMPIIAANKNLQYVYDELLIKGTLFLMDMEEVGIPICAERMSGADIYLEQRIKEAKEHIYTFPQIKQFEEDHGIIFNPNSVQQLRKVLFDYVGLTPTGKKTGTGAESTDAEVLEELADQHPLPAALLDVRRLTKIKSTYINKILAELDKDGRIRTNFNIHFTTSGRLSSSGKFNAQQIPRDDPIVKGCIRAPAGYLIVSQDLATAEMYYAAVLSGDKNLQEVFKSGGDFHSTIAKMVFDLPCPVEEVKNLYKDMRQSAKAISFGILYGSGPAKVSESVTKATGKYYPIERAKDDIEAYFTKFHKLKKWLKDREKFIRDNGFTYSHFGRKRRLPNVFSKDKGIAAGEVRSGINSEVQSIASDINLLAAIDTANEIKRKGLDAHIFMLVHDSIVALVREDQVEQYKEIVARNTQKDRNGSNIPGFPIGIDQEVGTDYSFGKFEKTYELIGNCLSRIPAKE